jgi:hypothetical protein
VLELRMRWHDAVRLEESQRSGTGRKDPTIPADAASRHHGVDLQRESRSLPEIGLKTVH